MKQFFSYLRNHYSILSKVSLFVLSVVVLILIFPKEGRFKYEFTKGKPWLHEDLIAPFDFAILKSADEINNEEQEVIAGLKPYFRVDDSITIQNRKSLVEDFNNKWQQKYKDKPRLVALGEANLSRCLEVYDSIMEIGILESRPEIEDLNDDEEIFLIRKNQVQQIVVGNLLTLHKADGII